MKKNVGINIIFCITNFLCFGNIMYCREMYAKEQKVYVLNTNEYKKDDIVAYLNRGDKINIVSEANDWAQVEVIGWLKAKKVKLVKDNIYKISDEYEYIKSSNKFFAVPDRITLYKDTQIEKIGQEDKWLNVKFTGWVRLRDLQQAVPKPIEITEQEVEIIGHDVNLTGIIKNYSGKKHKIWEIKATAYDDASNKIGESYEPKYGKEIDINGTMDFFIIIGGISKNVKHVKAEYNIKSEELKN